jgi:hypothetical protein
MAMNAKEFDERQLYIRGKVFFHGMITSLILLLINALLHSFGIVWANGFHQNVLIVTITATVISVEAILRDAYFGIGDTRKPIIAIFSFASLILIIFIVRDIVQGNSFFENGQLTSNGFSLIFNIMPISIAVCGIYKEITEKRK